MAVIVPDEDVLMAWAKANNVTETFEELCKSEVGQGQHVKGHENRSRSILQRSQK